MPSERLSPGHGLDLRAGSKRGGAARVQAAIPAFFEIGNSGAFFNVGFSIWASRNVIRTRRDERGGSDIIFSPHLHPELEGACLGQPDRHNLVSAGWDEVGEFGDAVWRNVAHGRGTV